MEGDKQVFVSENSVKKNLIHVEEHERSHVLVELWPFVNQVGGHTCVLEVDSQTICKPYVEREVWFYDNVPLEMREFIPQYYGEIDVKYDRIKGNRRLIACIPTSLVTKHGLLRHRHIKDDVIIAQSPKRGRKRSREFLEQTSASKDGCCSKNDNQWSMKCLERQITRYGFWANNRPQKFIMLGNLVSDYTYPCMMDIKMGRRQYGDDSSEEKRKLLENRCAKSTSSTLGFRICGTQVYQSTSGSYVIHDKYYGRYLDVDGVCDEMRFFFYDGVSLRTDVIRSTIRKLEKLHNVLRSENTLNLFSCSLLLIYDGHVLRGDQPEMMAQIVEVDKTCHHTYVDNACLSNSNVTNINVPYNDKSKTHADSELDIKEIRGSGNSSDSRERIPEVTGHTHATPNATGSKLDVRLIDFAHVSEKNDKQCENDDGESSIVFGLTKILDTLREILQLSRDT